MILLGPLKLKWSFQPLIVQQFYVCNALLHYGVPNHPYAGYEEEAAIPPAHPFPPSAISQVVGVELGLASNPIQPTLSIIVHLTESWKLSPACDRISVDVSPLIFAYPNHRLNVFNVRVRVNLRERHRAGGDIVSFIVVCSVLISDIRLNNSVLRVERCRRWTLTLTAPVTMSERTSPRTLRAHRLN